MLETHKGDFFSVGFSFLIQLLILFYLFLQVDSANKRGSLLEVVQVLTDLNLIIRRAYISSDGEWFMDVFHVTDQGGNKLPDDDIAERIQQVDSPNQSQQYM